MLVNTSNRIYPENRYLPTGDLVIEKKLLIFSLQTLFSFSICLRPQVDAIFGCLTMNHFSARDELLFKTITNAWATCVGEALRHLYISTT